MLQTLHGIPRLGIASALFLTAACGSGGSEVDLELLVDPSNEAFQATSPETFQVLFETTEGDFVVEVDRSLAPHGADRFYNLVRTGYYNEVRFFRVIGGSIAQFGINGTPRVAVAWAQATIPADPPMASNVRGTVSFAMRGPGSRTTQLFLNIADNSRLDPDGFAPIGRVVSGMEVVDGLHSGYGEMAPQGGGPAPRYILQRGNRWLAAEYPRLDYVKRASVVGGG